MNVPSLLNALQSCACGKSHTVGIRAVEIGRGLLAQTANILSENGFPKKILVVSGTHSFAAADGITDVLSAGGFCVRLHLFDGVHTSHQSDVDALTALCRDADGLLFVGAGSLGDVCRRACYVTDKEFAVFATAPSTDGFASDTAPITIHNFKISLPAREPSVIIADTDILAAAPAVLRSAGFGDMMGKTIGLADWKIGNLTTGEYYCDTVAALTRDAYRRVCAVADRIPQNDPESAGVLMEALVITGMAMKLCGSSRAAAGAEHIVSHFWEIKTLEQGRASVYHGRKVGAASLMITRMYYDICKNADPARFGADETDWERVFAAYGDAFKADVVKCNSPTVTEETSPAILREKWNAICDAVYAEMPAPDVLADMLRRAGAAAACEEIEITPELCLLGLEFHPYMRHRMLLSRLLPMLRCRTDYTAWAGLNKG
ncbi:MAG: iron-containing alcohol dehydrogenase [Clostridia bacterium]|nr:iron-containing alcohol dehydrogenase [Clostridia bacterium]